MAEHKKTGEATHRATRRGYAVDPKTGAGVLVEEGDLVPQDQPVALEGDHENGWMAPVKKADRDLAEALEEATDPIRKDVDITKLSRPALEALAAERGVNVHKGLSRGDLIAAIKTADEPRR
jgi:hypothetical protein